MNLFKPKKLTEKKLPLNKLKIKDTISFVKMKTEEYERLQKDPNTTTLPQIDYHYTTDMPKLTYNQGKNVKTINIAVASSQDDDETLLHQLFKKIKK